MSAIQELIQQKTALQQQAAEIDRQIALARRQQKAETISTIKALMSQHGLSASDLEPMSAKSGRGSANKGKKVAPKYRNPSTGETWTGRGIQPLWVKTYLSQQGATLESLEIK